MTYEIRWTEHSASKFEKLEKAAQERIIERLESAAENPFIVAKKTERLHLLLYQGWRLQGHSQHREQDHACHSSGRQPLKQDLQEILTLA